MVAFAKNALGAVRAAAVATAEGIRMKAEPRRCAQDPSVRLENRGRLRPTETPAGKAGIVALQQKHSWRRRRLSAYGGARPPPATPRHHVSRITINRNSVISSIA
jgi:hypothetical protein